MRLLQLFISKRHWYRITIEYSNKQKQPVLLFVYNIGVVDRSVMLNNRKIRRFTPNVSVLNNIQPYLCNGSVYVKSVEYLGRFRDTRNADINFYTAITNHLLLNERA